MSFPNVFEPEWEPGMPPGLRGARVGAAAGAQELGMTVYELEAGAAISPYHTHHGNEEALVVLSGRPLLRTPDGFEQLEPGAVRAFPRGPDGAHRVSNPEGEPARVLLISTMQFPDIADHLSTGSCLVITGPASGKVYAAEGELGVADALVKAMDADAEIEAQRGTSTS